MRSAADVRDAQVTMLDGILQRPGMFGHGQWLESTIRSTLHSLAFIDEREEELSQAFSALQKNGLFAPLGTAGSLASALRCDLHETDDAIAAVFARVASQLGYFQVEHRISAARWAELARLCTWPADWPRTPSAVEAELGAPSYRRAGQWPTVYAYAGPDDAAWLLLVFSSSAAPELEYILLPRYPLRQSVIDLRPRAITTSPEEVYRAILLATLYGDTETISKLIVHREDPLPFFETPHPADVAAALAEHFRVMEVTRVSAPAETVHLASAGCPVPLPVVDHGGSWRVDADPLARTLRLNRSA